jgi:hypothetical protein
MSLILFKENPQAGLDSKDEEIELIFDGGTAKPHHKIHRCQ